jgi:hypothetical protein
MKKIQMFHRVAGLATLYPPVMGNKYTPKWIETVREEYNKEWTDLQKSTTTNVIKCPGIFELFSKGFYVPLPYEVDFLLEEGKETLHKMPMFDSISNTFDEAHGSNLTGQSTGQQAGSMQIRILGAFDNLPDLKHMPTRGDTYSELVNLKTGWSIVSDVPLLFAPLPYPDKYEWETGMGILDTRVNSEVNAQIMFCNKPEGGKKEYHINAGEFLLFIVPLTHEEWSLESRELTEKDRMWLKLEQTVKRGWWNARKRTQQFFSWSECPFDLKKRKFKAFDRFWSK